MSDNYCDCGGWLVGAAHEIPTDDFDFSWGVQGPVIGCNNLRCGGCGETVRAAATDAEWAALNAANTAAPVDDERLYVCGCRVHVEDNQRALAEEADWDDDSPDWACAGHPALALPVSIDAVDLAADTDASALVAAHLGGSGTTAPPRFTAEYPSAWIHRLMHLFRGEPLAAAIGGAVAARLTDADPAARAAAVDLFRRDPQAPGAGDTVGALRDNPELYVGVSNPQMSNKNLDEWLQVAVAHRATAGDADALTAIKTAALGAQPTQALLRALATAEPAWLCAHATEVLRANPSRDVARRLLYVMAPKLGEDIVAPAVDMGSADLIARDTYLDLVRQLVRGERGDRIRDALS